MTTPLFKAMDDYVKNDWARFHVPGHKGNLPDWSRVFKYDITEVKGCDSLYQAEAAIAETERRYSRLYKTAASLLSTGGSTLCIQTMLALALQPRDKLICARGCHTSAINAMALLDLQPFWIYPEADGEAGLAKPVTAEQVRGAIQQNPDAKAVYITSPDYYGMICDIPAISAVCREYGVPLLIDNAHGAHLRFLNPPLHPIGLGADMCADSLHKTLPVLTGGSMLHIGTPEFARDAKRCMSVFGSTSPNYLIMASVDRALQALENGFGEALAATAAKVAKLEKTAANKGFIIPESDIRDPVRLTLGFGTMGYDTTEFLLLLRENGIEPEMAAGGFCVFMASPYNTADDFERLGRFIAALSKKAAKPTVVGPYSRPVAAKSLREAVFAKNCEIRLDNALNRIVGSAVSPCPPGIPLVVPGEVIDENLMLYLKNCGIFRINVLE